MKKMIASMLVLLMGITVFAQDLQKATTKGAVRLFGDKDDLTSVIELIPDGSNVDIIKADTVFTKIRFGEEEGYVRSDKLGPFIPVISPARYFRQPGQPNHKSPHPTLRLTTSRLTGMRCW
jgi:hypothetical protein